MKTKTNVFKRLMTLVLCILMCGGMFPATTMAALIGSETVTAVTVPEKTEYTVEQGTLQENIGLPKTLTVQITAPAAEEGGESTSRTEEADVTWEGSYDGNTAGQYTLTAAFSDKSYSFTEMPRVSVTVTEKPKEPTQQESGTTPSAPQPDPNEGSSVVTAVTAPEKAEYTVEQGTLLEDIGLPKMLTAELTAPSTEEGSKGTSRTEEFNVTWEGTYDANTVGQYTLTAEFSDKLYAFTNMPKILVAVTAKKEVTVPPKPETDAVGEIQAKIDALPDTGADGFAVTAENVDELTTQLEDVKAAIDSFKVAGGDVSLLDQTRLSDLDAALTLYRQTANKKKIPMKAPAGSGGQLQVTSEGLDNLSKDGDTILYGIVGDTAQTFNVNVPKAFFGSGDLTMTVSLQGVYGMAFTDNLASDLKEKSQIKDAYYTKDSNGNNTFLTVVIDGSLTENYLMALGTRYVVLTNSQCADIIANGYQDATIKFEVKNAGGDVIASNEDYTLRPEIYANTDIVIDEHKWTIGTDAAYLNWGTLSDGNPLRGQTLQQTDAFKMTVPVVSANSNRLVQFKKIKVYAPGEEFALKSVGKTAQYSGWGGITGPSTSGDYYFLDYFKSSDSYTAHDDGDGKGTYYWFEPRKPLYNNGTKSLTETQSYYAYFTWMVRDGIDYLEGSHTYAAENEVITCTAEAGEDITVDSNPGMIYTTLPVIKKDAVTFVPNTDYRKYLDKTGTETTKEQYIPGASYTGKRFITITNTGSYGDAVIGGTKQRVEYQTVKGTTTESYTFPYEIQPTVLTFSASYNTVTVVGTVTYTIIKEDGSSETHTLEYHKPEPQVGTISFADALASAGKGARISNVTILWDQNKNSGAYATFDYSITATHKDGTPLNGDMLQVEYEATCVDDGKTFDTATNQKNYFYLSMGLEKCPWLMADGSGYQRYAPKDLDNSEVNLCPYFFLKGLSGGSYRNYLENPVINLDAELAEVQGMDDPTCMLSGNMTLTKNTSGWKFSYTVYDTATGQSRDAEYLVPQLTGNTPLTRADLGLSDTEFFTDLKMSYDGTFVFQESTQTKQTSTTGDGAVAGTYDITMLLRDIKAYTRPTALKTDTRLSTPVSKLDTYCTKPTLRFVAKLTHSGTCDRAAHTGTGEAAGCSSIWNYPWFMIFSNYSYTAIGPNFSITDATARVTQGSSAIVTVDFALASRANEKYEGLSSRYKSMPWETPEAIYIELKDNQFDADTSNPQFQASLAAHGMTAQDVSVITAGGKHWLRLATPGNSVTTAKSASYAGTKHDNVFTIALKAWNGANVAPHKPLGEVYYDVSGLLKKYDGSKASGYVTEDFEGAVADTYGLLGDGDTTTARLWKGDLSDVTMEVLRNTVTGVTLLPGKNGIIDQSGLTVFEPDESKNLLASTTIKAPDTELYHYTTIAYIPQKDDVTEYTEMINGQQINGQKTCQFTMYLEGPAFTYRSSADDSTMVAYSYSKNGTDWVGEDAIAAGEWHEYRYIKTVVDIIAPYKSVETRYPISSDYKTQVGDFHNYVGGTWSYQDGIASTNVTKGKMMYGEFLQTDFTLRGPAGSIWWDVNEDGYNKSEKAAENITLKLYSPNYDVVGYDGKTITAHKLIDTTSTASDGSYRLRSYIAYADQVVEVVMPDSSTVITRQTSPTDTVLITDANDDSDFDRSTCLQTMPVFPKGGIENISCGLIKLPVITAGNVLLPIGDTAGANACGARCTSENPDNAAPNIVYETCSGDVADVGPDGAVSVTNKTGKVALTVSAQNTLGDEVSAKYDLTVYSTVAYDAVNQYEPAVPTGTAPTDSNKYYPSVTLSGDDADTDKVTVKSGSGLSIKGYKFRGWATDPERAKAETVDYAEGDTFKTGAVTKNMTFYAVWAKEHKAVHTFSSGTDGRALPAEIMSLRPADITGLYKGDTVNAVSLAETRINEPGATWVFLGWDKTSAVVEYDDIQFAGTWVYIKDLPVTLAGTKMLTENGAKKAMTAGQFSFFVSADAGNDTTGYIGFTPGKVDVKADGSFSFPEISFKKAGTYVFTIAEQNKGAVGYTYDGTDVTVTIVVNYDDATQTLSQVTTYRKGNDAAEEISFKNLYETPKPVEIPFKGQIHLKGGKRNDASIKKGEFSVAVTAGENNNTAGYTGVPTASVKCEARGPVGLGTWSFSKPGTYEFVVHQDNLGKSGYIYDDKTIIVSLTVTLDTATNMLETAVAYTVNNKRVDGIVFNNTHTLPGGPYKDPDTVAVTLDGEKTLTGPKSTKDIASGEFTFNIAANENNQTSGYKLENKTISVSAGGAIDFGVWRFNKTGVYKFTLTENDLGKADYTYDKTAYAVEVKVTRDKVTNELKASVIVMKDGIASDILFANSYASNSVKSDPPVSKVVKGSPSEAGSFAFVLAAKDQNNPMPEGSKDGVKEVLIQGAGSVEFGEITFTKAGTYEYAVSEKNTGVNGYTYDSTVYTVRYVVTDNNGNLEASRVITADGKSSDAAVFTNVYTAPVKPGNQPPTGDDSNMLPYVLLIISLLGIASVLIVGRKKSQNE